MEEDADPPGYSLKSGNKALGMLYGDSDVSLQQLAATFRRGDLIEKLEDLDRTITPLCE